MLAALCSDPRNIVYIISGRGRTELDAWFGPVVRSIALMRALAYRQPTARCHSLLCLFAC